MDRIAQLLMLTYTKGMVQGYSSRTVGRTVTIKRIITAEEVEAFSLLTGDSNPIHGPTFPVDKRFVHGALLNGIVAGVIGTRIPGPGTIVLSQEFKFPYRCKIDVPIEISVSMLEYRKIIRVAYDCRQMNVSVMEGTAKLMIDKYFRITDDEQHRV